jgi:FCD domain
MARKMQNDKEENQGDHYYSDHRYPLRRADCGVAVAARTAALSARKGRIGRCGSGRKFKHPRRYSAYRGRCTHRARKWNAAIIEHQQMIELLRKRDAEGLAQLMREHLSRKAAAVLAMLS